MVTEGPLAGQSYSMVTEVRDSTVRLNLFRGPEKVGHAYVEKECGGPGVVLWDVGVRKDLRRGGLASLMTRWLFREILTMGEKVGFRLRMVTSGLVGHHGHEVRNVGMCLIARRLGMVPDDEPAHLLRPSNVAGVEVIPRINGDPPAYKFTLNTFPLALFAFMLDRSTGRPVREAHEYVRMMRMPESLGQLARMGLLVPGNGDYTLRPGSEAKLVGCIALDETEAAEYRRRVVGLAP
jgi:hypothetical protein